MTTKKADKTDKWVTERSTKGLRETLFMELDDLRAGESTPPRSKAVTSLSGQILNTIAMQIAMAKFVSSPIVGKANLPVQTRSLPEIQL